MLAAVRESRIEFRPTDHRPRKTGAGPISLANFPYFTKTMLWSFSTNRLDF